MQRDASSTAIVRIGIPATLGGFATIAGHADGVNVSGLAPFTQLVVRTKNWIYAVNVQGGTSVIVRGGRFFQMPTTAEELVADGQRLVTTRVRTIGVEPPSGQSRPH